MKKQLGMVLVFTLVGVSANEAQDLPSLTQSLPSLTATPSALVPKPLTLTVKDKLLDTTQYHLPRPPHQYVDGTALVLINEVDNAPKLNDAALRTLTDIDVLEQIPVVNKADKNSGKYYWHPFKGWNYVHYRDGDRQWYGWRTGGSFHWLLWWSARFWWYDSYAERWLYFDRGFWWWQSLSKNNQIQVFLDDGHFHACDGNGALGDDLMQTGIEEDVTGTPVPRSTPGSGKKHGGHHGGGGGGSLGNSPPAPSGD